MQCDARRNYQSNCFGYTLTTRTIWRSIICVHFDKKGLGVRKVKVKSQIKVKGQIKVKVKSRPGLINKTPEN